MLCAGDEFGNSQRGNNNAYCQDNPVGWLDWPTAEPDTIAFVARLLALRRAEPLLHHDRWFAPEAQGDDTASVAWRGPDGALLALHDWHDRDAHALACLLTPAAGATGARLMLLFNPERRVREFLLPAGAWRCLLDSSATFPDDIAPLAGSLDVPAHALVVLRETRDGAGAAHPDSPDRTD